MGTENYGAGQWAELYKQALEHERRSIFDGMQKLMAFAYRNAPLNAPPRRESTEQLVTMDVADHLAAWFAK